MRKITLALALFFSVICAALETPVALNQGANWITNGEPVDTDHDRYPDDWQMIAPSRIDRLRCDDAGCWWQFGSFNTNRGLRQFLSPDLTGVTDVTFSFRGKGNLTDSGAAGAVYIYRNGQSMPSLSKFIQLPVGIAFDQTFTLTFALPPDTTGFHVDFTAARQGIWSVTAIRLEDAGASRSRGTSRMGKPIR